MKFGESLPARRALIQKLSKTTSTKTFPVDFQEDRKYLPVHSISIDFPRYRLENGRTGVDQMEYLAKHSSLSKDLFSKPESDQAQEHQHNILKTMIDEADLRIYFKNNKQLEPLILDSDGFVVNGNRRLCAMREHLNSKEKDKYKHFRNIEVVILPPSDKKAILELENRLQIQKDIKAGYKWHNTAYMFRRRLDDGMKSEDVQNLYDVTRKELNHQLAMFGEAQRYLESRAKAGQFSAIPDSKFAFDELVKTLNSLDEAKKDVFLNLAYVVIDKAEGRRAYEQIPKIGRDLEKIVSQLPSEKTKTKPSRGAGKKRGLELLGTKGSSAELLMPKLNTEQAKENARTVILNTIGEGDAQRREHKRGDYVRSQIEKATQCLTNAIDELHTASNKKALPALLTKAENVISKLKLALKR